MGSAAMHIARTGLDAQDMRMRTISNNLANVNTTGFKRNRASFETLAYQVVTAAGAPSTNETRYATGLNLGTDVNDTGFIQIAQGFFTDVRNIAGDFFLPQLGVTGHNFKFFDMQ